MEEIEEDPPPTPLWVRQQNTTFLQGDRHSSSSLFLNTGVLVMVLMLAAMVFLYAVVIPSFLNLTQKTIIKPSSVKKSWDSLNLVLVLFAIICGFLGRNNQSSSDQATTKPYDEDVQRPESVGHRNLSASDQWYESPSSSSSSSRRRRMEYGYGRSSSLMNSLRRNSSSYPDFQRESPWLTEADKSRFHDDCYVNGYRISLKSEEDLVPQQQRSASGVEEEDDLLDVKNIEVDTFVNRGHQQFESTMNTAPSPTARTQQPPEPPSPPPPAPRPVHPRTSSHVTPPPPPPALLPYRPHSSNVHKKRTRQAQETRHQNRRERSDMKELERKRIQAESRPPPPPPPPPPPRSPPPSRSPPPICELHSEAKSGRIRKKRGGVTVTKEILTSLYHQRKRKKKQRQISHESIEAVVPPSPRQSNALFPPPSPPPPPPPPPPPSSVFHNLFSTKKGKHKKVHSVPPSVPPTPPPPPQRRLPASVSHPSKSKTKLTLIASTKSNLPAGSNIDLSYGDETKSGSASPLVPIPPPPPPPPFKMTSWNFTVRGGYVKIGSNNNSPRSNSELDDEDIEEALSSGKESPSPMATGNRMGSNSTSPFFCPSPDVNTKADDFIARFRDKLKLERMDSISRQGNGRSRLSHESSPSQHSNQKASSSRYCN